MIRYFISSFIFILFCVYTNAQNNKRQPNVIVILADDLGWADLSSYGSTFYETPNLDKLAANGVRFTQNYATCPVCSPTRASMMTGKYPIKTGVTDWIKGRQENGKATTYEKQVAPATAYQLALKEKTIGEYALQNGYKTFFAGKWHLGEEEKYWPNNQGFETNIGGWSKGGPSGKINDSTGGYFTPYANPTLSDGPAGEYLTDRLTNESLDFMEKNKQSPFFLMFSMYAVHNPLQAPQALIKKYQAKQKSLGLKDKERFIKDEAWMQNENGWKQRLVQDNPVYAAMIENMDWNIGRLLEKIKALGIDDNTLVIFTSDNGGLSTAEGSPTVNGPLRAGKGWLYEGGIRVPLIMYWQGKLLAGTTSEIPVTTADIFPTIATAINGRYKKDKAVDGVNILKILDSPESYSKRPLYWHYPHYSNQGGKPGAAIRVGDNKLIYNYEDKSTELYDIKNDIAEQKNIAASQMGVAKRLKKQLLKWLKKNNALYPTPNAGYNPLAKSEVKKQDH